MDFKKIKILFYILFALDIAAGAAVAFFMSILHGIIVSAVLLILNITVYAIILKAQRIKEQSNGYAKKSKDI
ncbi:MAG: hypothetical protein LBL00_06575 [Endomicrobium sp.]|jgi:hypothetical protein|nr:hypothetical protein [Endomicrobium sp.]